MVVQSPFPEFALPECSFYEFLFRNASEHYHRTALVDAATGSKYTYGELLDEVARVASSFSRRYGICKGTVVVIFSPNRTEYMITILALHFLGAILAPANWMYVEGELVHHLEDCSAEFVVCGDGLESLTIKACKEYGKMKAIFTYGDHAGCCSYKSLLHGESPVCLPKGHIKPEDVVAYFYSSGTTGLPKGVILTNRNVTAQTFQYGAHFPKSVHQDNVLVFSPLSHALAHLVLAHTFSHSHALVLMEKFDFELYLKTVSIYKPRCVTIVPPIAVLLAKHPLVLKYDLSSIEELFCGAAPLHMELEEELRARFPGVHVNQGYGMTESDGATHMMPPFEERKGSVGPPCPNTEAKVIDLETGRELGQMETGEICMRGPQIMKGYLNKPEATAATVDKDGWLHSGDVGYYDNDGYFYIVDRAKELIKYKGLQVAPAELEDAILSMPQVGDVGVTWVPDTYAGELPIAFVVRKPGRTVTAKQIQDFIAARLAPYKQLRGGVRFVDEIPKSASGKILRRVLREMVAKSKL